MSIGLLFREDTHGLIGSGGAAGGGREERRKREGEAPFCGIFAPDGGEKGINKKSQAKSLDKFDFL